MKVRKISEEDFHCWKCQAVMMRDDCTAGIITLEEFTAQKGKKTKAELQQYVK